MEWFISIFLNSIANAEQAGKYHLDYEITYGFSTKMNLINDIFRLLASYTAKNAQVATKVCCLFFECARMACDSLLTTSQARSQLDNSGGGRGGTYSYIRV